MVTSFTFLIGRMSFYFDKSQGDWYRNGDALEVAFTYYRYLRDFRKEFSDRSVPMVACCRCKVLFLTSPTNEGRTNLYCPFGCRRIQGRERLSYSERKALQKAVQCGVPEALFFILRYICQLYWYIARQRHTVVDVWNQTHALLTRHGITAWGIPTFNQGGTPFYAHKQQ